MKQRQPTLDAFLKGAASPAKSSTSTTTRRSQRTVVATPGPSRNASKGTTATKSPKSPAVPKRLASPTGSSGYDEYEVIRGTQFEPKSQEADDGDDSESSDEAPPLTSPIRKRVRRPSSIKTIEISDDDGDTRPRSPGKAASESSESSDSEITYVGMRSPGQRFAPGKAKAAVRTRESDSEADSGEEGPSNLKRRRLSKGTRPQSRNIDEDEEDEEDDIMDGIDEEKVTRTRLRTQIKRSTYDQKLDKLRKKKSGIKEDTTSEEESSGEAASDDAPLPNLFKGARPTVPSDEEDEAAESDKDSVDSFIIDDSASSPTKVHLPAQFSMNSHQDLPHLFKIVCQYMVHLAMTKPERRRKTAKALKEDEYFSIPIITLRRKLDALKDSLASSLWRPAYKKPLMTIPELQVIRMDFAIPKCDACNLGSRMSTLTGRLVGDAYDPVTYEPKPSEEGESDSDEEDEPKLKREFQLGRFCARRTRVFHGLAHWEFNLFEALNHEVERTVANHPRHARLKKIDGVKPPDDPTNADQVMDWLDQRRIIEREWGKINQLMTDAEDVDNWKGEDD